MNNKIEEMDIDMFDTNLLKEVKKNNSLIRGKLSKYSLEQIKLLNSVYGILYKSYFYDEKTKGKKLPKVNISFDTLFQSMGYKTDEKISNGTLYSKFNIKDKNGDIPFVDVLQDKIMLNDYIDKEGQSYVWKSVILFPDVGVKKNTSGNRTLQNKLEIHINPTLYHLFNLMEKKNFTFLNILEMNKKFKTVYQYRLYEFLKSYENMKQKFITIDLETYTEIFEEKKITYLSEILRKIKRNLTKENPKNKNCNIYNIEDLKIEILSDKKYKTITFKFLSKNRIEKNIENAKNKKLEKIRKQDEEEQETLKRIEQNFLIELENKNF